MLHWSTCMAAYVGQPPDPAVVGDGWRDALARAARGDGAVGRDVARPPAPRRLLAPGLGVRALRRHRLPGVRGRRLVRRLPRHRAAACSSTSRGARARADRAVGAHVARSRGAPGPAIGFLQELRALLRRRAQGRGERLLRRAGAGQLHAGADRPRAAAARSGRGAGSPTRPGRRRNVDGAAARRSSAPERALRGLQLTGLEAGVWCGDGSPADGAGDQRPEDGASLCWDAPPLGERLELLGHAAAELELTRRPAARARRRAAVRGRARRQRRR